MMNFNHLFYFYAVVKEGSISAAARKLHVSQPALSTQIKCLEEHFGLQLFVRRGRKIQITDKGRFVFGYAKQIFELAEGMLKELGQVSPLEANRLRLGVADDIERPFSVRLVSLLLSNGAAQSAPMVALTCGSHETLTRKLEDGELDAFLSDRSPGQDGMEVLGSSEMPVMLAIAPGRLPPGWSASHDPVGAALMEGGLVMPSSKLRLRQEIDEFLEERKATAHIVLESDLLASVVRGVVDGVGASFLPTPYIAEGIARREILVFGPSQGFWQHSLWLISNRKSAESNALVQGLKSAFEILTREIQEFRAAA